MRLEELNHGAMYSIHCIVYNVYNVYNVYTASQRPTHGPWASYSCRQCLGCPLVDSVCEITLFASQFYPVSLSLVHVSVQLIAVCYCESSSLTSLKNCHSKRYLAFCHSGIFGKKWIVRYFLADILTLADWLGLMWYSGNVWTPKMY